MESHKTIGQEVRTKEQKTIEKDNIFSVEILRKG